MQKLTLLKSLTKFPLNNRQQSKYEKKINRRQPSILLPLLLPPPRLLPPPPPNWDPPYSYNGGQKCWGLSCGITKTSGLFPPTSNKVEFWAKWLEMSAFLATTLLGGVGDRRMNPKPNQKWLLGAGSYLTITWKVFFTHFQVPCFVLHCSVI